MITLETLPVSRILTDGHRTYYYNQKRKIFHAFFFSGFDGGKVQKII